MEVDGAGEVAVTESQKNWRGVQDSLRNEDFEKAIQLCNTGVLAAVPGYGNGTSTSAPVPAVQRPTAC